MYQLLLKELQVSVDATYQENVKPSPSIIMFSLQGNIENKSAQTVSTCYGVLNGEIMMPAESHKIVEADELVVNRPILEPGESHKLTFWCTLKSGWEKMNGVYFIAERIS